MNLIQSNNARQWMRAPFDEVLSVNIYLVSHAKQWFSNFQVHPETVHARPSELLRLLPKRGPKAFDVFVDALVKTEQSHLAEILHGDGTASIQKSTHQQETDVVYPQQDTRGIFFNIFIL